MAQITKKIVVLRVLFFQQEGRGAFSLDPPMFFSLCQFWAQFGGLCFLSQQNQQKI